MLRVAQSLRAGRSGDRIPVVWGRDFPHLSRPAPGAHPASYKMCTRSFPGVKRPGHGVDHPPLSSAEVEGTVELYIYSPLGLRGLFYGDLYLYLYYGRKCYLKMFQLCPPPPPTGCLTNLWTQYRLFLHISSIFGTRCEKGWPWLI